MSKRASYIEEEIEVKPSAELIPDEYEHFQDYQKKFVLHTFVTDDEDDQQNETNFLNVLKEIGYGIKSIDRHSLEKDDFQRTLGEIVKASYTNDAGLILFFSGCAKRKGQLEIYDGRQQTTVNIQLIWTKFDSHNCPELKNKPKIFIFALSSPPEPIQTDSNRYYGVHLTGYDTPAEADILVIYNNKVHDESNDFMTNFCDNIKTFGDTENIITLASSALSLSSTIIISTLTRNFYFTVSNLRGHHLVIEKHNEEIKTHVEELKDKLNKRCGEKKGKRSFLGNFSFRRKSKPEEDNNVCSDSKDVNVASSSTTTISSKPQVSTNPIRHPSVPSSRTRHISQSESDGIRRTSLRKISDNKNDKPIWRP